jgi:hypothetical protein
MECAGLGHKERRCRLGTYVEGSEFIPLRSSGGRGSGSARYRSRGEVLLVTLLSACRMARCFGILRVAKLAEKKGLLWQYGSLLGALIVLAGNVKEEDQYGYKDCQRRVHGQRTSQSFRFTGQQVSLTSVGAEIAFHYSGWPIQRPPTVFRIVAVAVAPRQRPWRVERVADNCVCVRPPLDSLF